MSNAQGFAGVTYNTTNARIQAPRSFFFTNILMGTNIVIYTNGNGTITIAGTVVGGGSGDAGGTNARQYGSLNLTNWSLYTTNVLGDTATNAARNIGTIVSNGVITEVITSSNNLYATESTRNAAVSNGAVSFTMTASNNLYSTETTRNAAVSNAVIAEIITSSNNLRTTFVANDTTTSNGLLTIINPKQFGSASLTNLSGNPNVVTNILGAGTVTVTSNNQGTFTITGSGGAGSVPVELTNIIVYGSSSSTTNLTVRQTIGQTAPMLAVRGTNGTMLSGFDEHGHLILSNLVSTLPITNTVEIDAEDFGRLNPMWIDSLSNRYAFGSAMWSTRQIWFRPGSSANLSFTGSYPVTNGGCTVSTPAITEEWPLMAQFASGATSNNSASCFTELAVAYRGTKTGANGFFFSAEWGITNGVIEFGGGGLGVFVGLSDVAAASQTNMATTTNLASTRYAGFAVHSQLGSGATNWHFITKDNSGANETRTVTPLPLLASNIYRGQIYCGPQAGIFAVRLDNLTTQQSTNFYVSSVLPTNALRAGFAIANRTNRIHAIRMSSLYLESPLRP